MRPFDPLLANPHAQTILGAFWPRPFDEIRYPVTATCYQTDADTQVLVHSQQPAGPPQSAILLVHGLEGSSQGGYMRSAAHALLEAGFAVHRMNVRSCGGTEALSNTLYHAGLTSDIEFILRALAGQLGHPVYLCGFSLGANMALKLAGELGAAAAPLLSGVISISSPLDLKACALELNHPRNWLYQNRFVRNMAARLRRRHALMPDRFSIDRLPYVKTVYEFDDHITAPFFGFGTAEGYYSTQSSRLFLDAIRIPTLLIHAQDDPMIPFHVYNHPAFRSNPHLTLVTPPHGGHVGFLARGAQGRFWIDQTICAWLATHGEQTPPHSRL